MKCLFVTNSDEIPRLSVFDDFNSSADSLWVFEKEVL